MIYYQNFHPISDARSIAQAYKKWAKTYIDVPPQVGRAKNHIDRERRLRIGYMASGFHLNPVGQFIKPVITNHNPKVVETYCYGEMQHEDDLTERLKQEADHWRTTQDLGDDDVAELICHDEIDIPINSACHTAGHRLEVLAHKPAPVLVAWMGGPPVTTGFETVDYFLTDRFQTPPKQVELFVESVYRMPNDYTCYEPPTNPPDVSTLPASDHGFVTFGCINPLTKLNDDVMALWSQILLTLPDAGLLLKTRALRDELTGRRILDRFAGLGSDPGRIDLMGGHREAMATCQCIDIALDPFPFTGGITTLESLWMGVTMIALDPPEFAVRHAISHLNNANCPQFTAKSPKQYVDLAVSIASDVEDLVRLRSTLREQMGSSLVCDTVSFTRDLESAYRTMRRRWCSRQRHP